MEGCNWLGVCFSPRMNAISFKMQARQGGDVKVSAIPANHSAQPHFGLLDAAIVAVFLLAVGGLVCLLALS